MADELERPPQVIHDPPPPYDPNTTKEAVVQIDQGLAEVDLGCKRIGDDDAIKVAEAVKRGGKVTILDLACNRIGDKGAARVAEVLPKNKVMTTLYLDGNLIGDEGACRIADALEKNNTLTVLNISGNRMTEVGISRLFACLETHPKLAIDLRRNVMNMDPSAEAILRRAR
eukprot:gnl/TRDRNA2_/TRDRNA2_141555_c0_seq1.p1 gnl/TRDRNA2_/TRDRNA2_141555_c0~~gnl/TRDRNA2_/TRDRNA2_141555_c0_seq1.p1  ORF type:complete len:197 (-),score=42.13 gnl/TRDRNA2_/TRDRNA2_141555_c0_seq1:94-606(-)